MATKPTKKGTKSIGVNMPIEDAKHCEQAAKKMGVSTGAYIKFVLADHWESGRKITISEE